MIQEESWFPFSSGQNRYFFSDRYRIKSVINGKEKMLSIGLTADGYPRFQMSFNKKKVVQTVHRVVGELFVPNPFCLKEINHKDGNKLNFNKENIEWCTRSHNVKHAFSLGLKDNKGVKHGNCKLTNKIVLEILKSNKPTKEICVKYGIGKCTVSDIKTGARWNHITKLPKTKRKKHLSDKQVVAIFQSPLCVHEIAKKFNLTAAAIRNIKYGKSHSKITKRLLW